MGSTEFDSRSPSLSGYLAGLTVYVALLPAGSILPTGFSLLAFGQKGR